MARMGRPPRILPEHREVLVRLTKTHPSATLRELQVGLERKTRMKAHEVTLLEAEIRRSRDGSQVHAQAATPHKRRHGYTGPPQTGPERAIRAV